MDVLDTERIEDNRGHAAPGAALHNIRMSVPRLHPIRTAASHADGQTALLISKLSSGTRCQLILIH